MKKKILLGFMTFCLMFTVISALSANVQAQDSKAKDLAKQADRLFSKKKYREAIDKYAEAVAISPDYSYAHFWKGYSHYYLLEYDPALSELDTAFKQGQKPQDVYKVRWYVNYQLNHLDDALRDATEGLKADPDNVMLKAGLADIYYAKKDYSKALAYYKEIVEQIPNNADVYYFIANSHYNLGETEAQAIAAQKAIYNNTKFNGEAYYLVADAMQRAKKYDDAIEAYLKVKNVDPKIVGIYSNLSKLYRAQGKFKKAIDITKEGLLLFPNDAGLYVDLSWYQSLSGQPKEAIGSAQRALVFDSNRVDAHTLMCRGYNSIGEYQKATTACNKALELKPGDGETNLYLGFVTQSLNKDAEAKEYFEKAVEGLTKHTEANSDESDGFYLLGSAYYSDGQVKKAISAYEKSLQLSPLFARAHYNLAVAYFVDEQKDLANKEYEALLNLDKDLAADLKGIIKQ